MLNFLQIPPPPLPGGATLMLIGAVAVLVGIVLLMWGRVIWRVVSCLTGVGAGVLLGQMVARQMNVPPIAPLAIAVVVLAGVGLVLARLYWAAVLAGVLTLGALLGVLHFGGAIQGSDVPTGFQPAVTMTLQEWGVQTAKTTGQWLQWMYHNRLGPMSIAASLTAVLGLVMGLVRPIFTRIFTTSLLGCGACVLGACLVIGGLKSGFDFGSGVRPWILTGIGGVLCVIGLVYQYLAELRSEKKDDQDKEAAPPEKQKASAERSRK